MKIIYACSLLTLTACAGQGHRSDPETSLAETRNKWYRTNEVNAASEKNTPPSSANPQRKITRKKKPILELSIINAESKSKPQDARTPTTARKSGSPSGRAPSKQDLLDTLQSQKLLLTQDRIESSRTRIYFYGRLKNTSSYELDYWKIGGYFKELRKDIDYAYDTGKKLPPGAEVEFRVSTTNIDESHEAWVKFEPQIETIMIYVDDKRIDAKQKFDLRLKSF